jgi:HPt (histidine-containing phosphotransfer) domain-containing protein
LGLTREAIQRIRDAVGDDDLVMADILQSFVDEVDGLLGQLTAAAASRDLKTLDRVAHTLKSSCRDLGDEATGDICAKLEGEARAGSVTEPDAVTQRIAERIFALKTEVVGYLASGPDGPIRS